MIMTDTGNLAMYIGGQWVAATDGAVLPIVNPTTEEHHGTIPAAGAKDVAVAVEAAAAAGPGWRPGRGWTAASCFGSWPAGSRSGSTSWP